jgi:hypothetical protein
MLRKDGTAGSDRDARKHRLVLWLSIAAFVTAGGLIAWDYRARIEEERRLEPYFRSEAILEAARNKWPDSIRGSKDRARRAPPTALPDAGAAKN